MHNSIVKSELKGLTKQEVTRMLQEEGYNELPSNKPRGILAITLDVLREPMFILLLAGGGIYLSLGDTREALMLLGFVLLIIGITIFQEQKTEHTLEALKNLASPRALVIREGKQQRIPGREVVVGDILLLAEGDRVPADALLLNSLNLSTDEAILTGESVPVRKTNWAGTTGPELEMRPGGDDLPLVFSGTLVVQGRGMARVTVTGAGTEIGKIGRSLQRLKSEKTALQKETGGLVRLFAIIGFSLCSILFIIYGLTQHNWLDGLLAGITLAMAILPDEFPVVLTIFLALGAWRISQNKVLTRRIPAVETLGAATVLCVDKTGTLTLNEMEVGELFTGGTSVRLDEIALERPGLPLNYHPLLETAVLASHPDGFDPMERAIRKLGGTIFNRPESLHKGWQLVREYPLTPQVLAMSIAWKAPGYPGYVIAAKGAPEAIATLCRLDPAQAGEMLAQVHSMANEGLRVLGAARAYLPQGELPADQQAFKFEFAGLVGLIDPVRPTVPAALAECRSAGIRVVMITGDYPTTARAIANRIGLASPGGVLTGADLDKMDLEGLREAVKPVNIFARVAPEQKLRLVEAFKADGEIVAMTGDGVNDAPALKAAHIGIAMGRRGTDVAREAAALVLLDDDFASIVRAIKVGRRIFDNLRKAMTYILAVHVPIAGMSLIPVFFNWPLVLLPVHIAFLHLIIDPACSIVFEMEPEEDDVMLQPPRRPSEALFSLKIVGLSLLQGFSILVILVVIFALALYRGEGELDARALTFTTLIIANLGLIITNRAWSRTALAALRSPNPAVWWVSGGAIVFLGLVLYLPFLRDLFHFSFLHPVDLGICLVSGLVSVFWFEILKALRKVRG
jgi:Ca2+-transporting ATPase